MLRSGHRERAFKQQIKVDLSDSERRIELVTSSDPINLPLSPATGRCVETPDDDLKPSDIIFTDFFSLIFLIDY